MQLQGTGRVLLAPELDEKVRHPGPEPEQPVHPRVAPGTKSDRRVLVASAPLPAVQMQPAAKQVPAFAGPAPAAVAPDRGFAVAGKMAARVGPGAPESPASADGWGCKP